ncbi:hypothetical protein [Butyrivibrio sp. INlla14]|uniref:hypothetical protein n=1 Tax=Butyrivibrio sp. INlla14 TaxID=1520808 RepID=UPI000876786E|nr:hypothetical protein [Butyrivibrio sp. INlla14]SCY28549.1 hypothetical protein SAMN02910371_01697 [Butyrivibrio sp. INlla14]
MITIFDAALMGDFELLMKMYKGDVNCINEDTKLNLLQTIMCGDGNYEQRKAMVFFLIDEGIDINYQGGKHKRNALHILYSSLNIRDEEFIITITNTLLEAGIDINQKDAFGAIPLSYLISGKLGNGVVKSLLSVLKKYGVKCHEKDNYGNSCVDYANQFPWRKEIAEEMKNED